MERNAWRNSHSHVTGTLLNSDFPFRFMRSIIRLSRVYTVPPPCRFARAVLRPCNERLPTAQPRPGAGPKHKHKKLASSMRRHDKIRARWDTTDSTSYIFPFPDIPSSQAEFEKPSPIQYQHERTKAMLVQLLQELSSEKESDYEGCDSKFQYCGIISISMYVNQQL